MLLQSMQKEQVGFGELDWFADTGLFGEQVPHKALAPAEVPQLPGPQSSNYASYRPPKSNIPYKKPRIEISNDDIDDYFTVPDLGWNLKRLVEALCYSGIFGNMLCPYMFYAFVYLMQCKDSIQGLPPFSFFWFMWGFTNMLILSCDGYWPLLS